MEEKVCGYCDRETRRSQLKWNYQLECYVCQRCRGEMFRKWGNRYNEPPPPEVEEEVEMEDET